MIFAIYLSILAQESFDPIAEPAVVPIGHSKAAGNPPMKQADLAGAPIAPPRWWWRFAANFRVMT
jgi:hypothetical protein